MACLLLGVVAPGCGSSQERQDADEPSGEFPVEVSKATFPARQRLADTQDLTLEIENVGNEDVPNLAITIYTGDEKADGPFNVRSEQTGLADPNRPVWILENGYPKVPEPGAEGKDLDAGPSAGSETASVDTFALGPLEPNDSITVVWRVTPVQPGTFTVHYEVSAGLHGKAKAVTSDGSPVEGEFVTTISQRPPQTHVTESGKVEPQP